MRVVLAAVAGAAVVSDDGTRRYEAEPGGVIEGGLVGAVYADPGPNGGSAVGLERALRILHGVRAAAERPA
ncbi:hypothetical protein ACQPZP_03450 [Spirillospora sp. CA-142024]|uniref:hypothetical protein n=1 Tax=Spirillospora sp. CA-142024 TaxID=3240036 RepID=UPI003D8DB812